MKKATIDLTETVTGGTEGKYNLHVYAYDNAGNRSEVKAQTLIYDKTNTKEVAECLLNGGVVSFPTDTVYGIACNSFSEKAINKLSIPIIAGASLFYPLLEINFKDFSSFNWTIILIGTLVSGIVGYLCIKFFMKFLAKFSLTVFGYYCILVGTFAFIIFNII